MSKSHSAEELWCVNPNCLLPAEFFVKTHGLGGVFSCDGCAGQYELVSLAGRVPLERTPKCPSGHTVKYWKKAKPYSNRRCGIYFKPPVVAGKQLELL